MPIASALAYVQGLLDNLPMPPPLGVDPLDAYVIPPDPNVQTTTPAVYVWPTRFKEARDPKYAGSMSRNQGPGTPAGFKTIVHSLDLFIVWMGAGDDPSFPGIVDAVMAALRFSFPMPVLVTDPNTGFESQISNLGEVMDGQIYIRALEDEAWNRFDSLITLPVIEVIQA